MFTSPIVLRIVFFFPVFFSYFTRVGICVTMFYAAHVCISFFLPPLTFNLEGFAAPRMLIGMILQVPDFLGRQRLLEAMPALLTISFMIIALADSAEDKSLVQSKVTALTQGNCSFKGSILFISKGIFCLRMMNHQFFFRTAPFTTLASQKLLSGFFPLRKLPRFALSSGQLIHKLRIIL
jgi:hypothetical protein